MLCYTWTDLVVHATDHFGIDVDNPSMRPKYSIQSTINIDAIWFYLYSSLDGSKHDQPAELKIAAWTATVILVILAILQ